VLDRGPVVTRIASRRPKSILGGAGCFPNVATRKSLSSFLSSRMTLIVGWAHSAGATDAEMSRHASGRLAPPPDAAR
jgi:hypothetical protein